MICVVIYLIDGFVNLVYLVSYVGNLNSNISVFDWIVVALVFQLVVIATSFYWWSVVNSHYHNLSGYRGMVMPGGQGGMVISGAPGGVLVPGNVVMTMPGGQGGMVIYGGPG